MYLNFRFLDQFFLSYRAKTHTHGNTHTHTDAHKDSNEYYAVAFCKNATIIMETRECEAALAKESVAESNVPNSIKIKPKYLYSFTFDISLLLN